MVFICECNCSRLFQGCNLNCSLVFLKFKKGNWIKSKNFILNYDDYFEEKITIFSNLLFFLLVWIMELVWIHSNTALTTAADKMIEENSSFYVRFLFSRNLLFALTKFSFWREDWTLGYNSTNFWHNSEVLSRSATRSPTRIHQFITNNQASFHLWWNENLVKHQKFSKYYDDGCSYPWNLRLFIDGHMILQNYVLVCFCADAAVLTCLHTFMLDVFPYLAGLRSLCA